VPEFLKPGEFDQAFRLGLFRDTVQPFSYGERAVYLPEKNDINSRQNRLLYVRNITNKSQALFHEDQAGMAFV
jgi:hypothetical protein